ncbi:MAG: serine/threonine-protein kinase [Planctomycetia bacterium]|nr:serine/threonine-protein kinase [Planctomycetia bacterium]
MGIFDSIKKMFSGSEKLNVADRFQIMRTAISGTMSSFYQVKEHTTGKIYGLKIIDMKKLEEVDARFKGMVKPQEGEMAMKFIHPYVVKTYEYGMTTKDQAYLLMEYLAGGGLNMILSSAAQKLDGRRLYYLKQGAEAIKYVHESGYIHRDICPRNFILTGDLKIMKLTDFGLTVPATPQFMQPGNRTGTPNYMAPELVRRKPTSQQLDVFSFGVSAYEIMTGRLPWEAGKDGRAALSHDTPAPDITQFRPQIHPILARAIHLSIMPDTSERLKSMAEFLQMVGGLKNEDVS